MSETQGATITYLDAETWRDTEVPDRRTRMTAEALATPMGAAFAEWNQANERAMREYERRQEAREMYYARRFGPNRESVRRVA